MENLVIKSLCERRSVRKYQSRQVDEGTLVAILKTGTYAATGMNRQSPIIVAVQDPCVREQLRKMNADIMGTPDADPFYGAPTILVVLADRNIRTHVEDGSLVLGNLMHAAHALGVDSCWIHRAREEFACEEGKKLLAQWGITGDYVGVGHLALGYRDCDYPEARARKEGYIVRV